MGGVKSAIRNVYERIRNILNSVRNWLISFVEPEVTSYVNSQQKTINSANNPHQFAKTVTCQREKNVVDREYQKNRKLLTISDKRRLDNMPVY